MAEKIIALDINDASARVQELFADPDEVTGLPEDVEIRLKYQLAILIENPDVSTNTYIAHNPLDVTLDALAVLADVPVGGQLEVVLGRERRVLDRNVCVVSDPFHVPTNVTAGHFDVFYDVRHRKGLRWLDCHVFYEDAEAYDFLIQDFATMSFCMQFVALQNNLGLGNLHIRVKRPGLLRQNQQHFDWIPSSEILGIAPLAMGPLAQREGFLTELHDVLQTNDPPMGLHSPFTRKVVAPAMMILNALHKNDLIQADVVSRQLPRGLDWSLAVAKFLESKGV